ncbi:unnamed protein product [Hymenolepis diminuta]|uniref:Uncharacterized protein n=1 Tax=Hymenolepis diminuta TaxID=6216 RepID=A0A564ZC23_HYMDI|nr:unnamed protein product [Hymenolepis diminuta]
MSSFALLIDISAKDVAETVYEGLTKTSKAQDCLYIDCKYYTASIQLKKISESESKSSIDDAEGIIVCFDPNKLESLKLASEWLEVDKDENIPIRLLVCETLPASAIATYIFKIATSNHFEVIQLSPNPDEIEEDEEYGVNRILSAMTAHEWSNLTIKDSRTEPQKTITHQEPDVPVRVAEVKLSDANNKEVEGSIDEEFDDKAFSELFPKLMEVRSKASCLDLDKRRKMAEKERIQML